MSPIVCEWGQHMFSNIGVGVQLQQLANKQKNIRIWLAFEMFANKLLRPVCGACRTLKDINRSSPSLLYTSNASTNLIWKQNESTYTHMYDSKLYTDQLFSKPKRWPEYNKVIHPPEDGPVERVCDAKKKKNS